MTGVEWRQRLTVARDRLPAWVVTTGADMLLAVAVAALSSYRLGVEFGPDPPMDAAPAFGLSWLMAAGLVARRRWPLAVLVWVFWWWMVYQVVSAPGELPGGAPQPPMWVALYTAAAAERRRGLVPVAVVMLVADWLGRAEEGGAAPFGPELDSSTVVWVAMLLLGDGVRSRRKLRAEQRARLAQADAEAEREAERRVADERVRIARELHDVTAHTISVIAVQSGVAEETLADEPDRARAALGVIRHASSEAIDELKATVGMLRQPDAPDRQEGPELTPMPGLEQLDDLLGMAEGSDLTVERTVDGVPRPLPPAVDLTAFRIVQESLTNVLRHAGARTVTVTVGYRDGGVLLEVGDDGTGLPAEGAGARPGGYGLRGMRERAEAVGGSVETGPGPRGGLTVRAWLPTAAGHGRR